MWTPDELGSEIAFDWPAPAVRPIDMAESRLDDALTFRRRQLMDQDLKNNVSRNYLMNLNLKSHLIDLAGSRPVKELVADLIDNYAERSDNTIDDAVARGVRESLLGGDERS